MDVDFDQTQAIFLEDFDEEKDEESDHLNRTPVAYLKLTCQKDFPEKTFPLFEGENIIGRHEESCSVCIPLKALSREHACIEIKGDSHLIYDKDSRNKTKRNKLYLSPNVRYELRNGDCLMFGDVACKFTLSKPSDSDTGSETEYQTANDVVLMGKKDETIEFEEEEYDSDNSVDLLQPTQAYANHTHRNNTRKSLLPDESLDEKGINQKTLLVGETPVPRRQKVTSAPLVEESGSETEDETDARRGIPQTLVVEESQKDESGDAEMLFAPTQAYAADFDSDSTDLEEGGNKTIFTEATQAFPDIQRRLAEKTEVESTQTFVEESDSENEEEKKKKFQYAATQAYHDVDDYDEPTQTTEDETEAVVETDDEDVSHLFVESTLACDADDFPDEDEKQMIVKSESIREQDGSTQVTLDEPTQAVVTDEATQVVCSDKSIKVVNDHEYATRVVNKAVKPETKGKQKPVKFDDATVAVLDETQVVHDDATVAVTGEDATVAVQEHVTVAVEEDSIVAVQEDVMVAVQEDPAVAHNNATVAVHEDATVGVQEDATVSILEDATVAVQEDSTVSIPEDATVAVQEDTAVVTPLITKPSRNKGRGRPKKAEITSNSSTVHTQEVNTAVSTQIKVKGPAKNTKRVELSDSDVSGSQESEEGGIRKSSRAKRKSLRMVEMEQSMDDLIGIDKSIAEGEDYSPENSESDSPKKSKETRGRKPTKSSKMATGEKYKELENQPEDISDVPEEVKLAETVPTHILNLPTEIIVVKQSQREILLSLPALQMKDVAVIPEATQAYTLDADELMKSDMAVATQPYVMLEEDPTPPLEEKDDVEGDITPPIEDVLAATQNYSLEEEFVPDSEEIVTKPALIPIPSRSPLKPALRSPEKRKKSPSPKRVQFTVKKIDSTSTNSSENDVATKDGDAKPSTHITSTDVTEKTTEEILAESEKDETNTESMITTKRGRKTIMSDVSKKQDELVTTTKTRGRRSVVTDTVPQDKSRGRKSVVAEKVNQELEVISDNIKGKVAIISDTSEQLAESSNTATKTRGRKSVASNIKSGTVVEKKDNDIEESETVMLISDGEKDKIEDVEKPTRKGRSKLSVANKIDQDNSNLNKNDKTKIPELDEKSQQSQNNLQNRDSQESVELSEDTKSSTSKVGEEHDKKPSVGRRGRSLVTKIENEGQELTLGKRGRQAVGSSVKNTKSDDKLDSTYSRDGEGLAAINESESRSKNDIVNKKSDESEVDVTIKQKGRRGRSSVLPRTETVKSEETAVSDNTTNVKLPRKRGKVENKDSKNSEHSEELEPVNRQESVDRSEDTKSSSADSIKTEDLKQKASDGKRGRSVVTQIENEGQELKLGIRGRKVVGSSVKITESDDKLDSTKSGDGESLVAINESESKNNDDSVNKKSDESAVDVTIKQKGRRGRSSVLPCTETVKSEETAVSEDTTNVKLSGRKGKNDNKDSKNTSKLSEVLEPVTKQLNRRSRASVVNQSETNDTKQSESNDSESKKRGGQRSSSQPPNKQSEESFGTAKGRRGRSVIQSTIDKTVDETMPPPKTAGRRGKTVTENVDEESAALVNQDKNPMQSKANESINDSIKVESENNEKSFNLDVTLHDNSQDTATSRGRSSVRGKNKESVDTAMHEDLDSKPTRGKRKRDSSVDNSVETPSTSKRSRAKDQTENETNTKNSTGKSNTLKTDSQCEENRSRSRSRSQQNESKDMVKEINDDRAVEEKTTAKGKTKTGSQKRGRTEDENSPGTPVKKAKAKHEQQSPQQHKTLGVGSPSLRRKSVEPTKPRIMFTGVVDEHGQKVIKELGGELVNNVNECTHLVTDKVRRTVKFLCCLARGIPIITLQWIESCKQSAMFVDAANFEVKDTATEKQYKFSLHRSIERAKETSLLKDYKIHVTKSVKPEPEQMKEIIECAGGQYLSTMPKKPDINTVIISCPDDESNCTAAIKAGVPVVSSEFILTGILKQEVCIKSYALFNTDSTDSQNSSSSSRRKR